MRYRRILVLASLVVIPGFAVASGCVGYAVFNDCTREEVKDGGCERCPVTCHDYDNEDAGDAATDAATDADAAD